MLGFGEAPMTSTNGTSEPDAELAELLAQLSAPTSDAVRVPPPAESIVRPPVPPHAPPPPGQRIPSPLLPELWGADALAASPAATPPVATPAVAMPVFPSQIPAPAAPAPRPRAELPGLLPGALPAPAASSPPRDAPAASDFSAILFAPPSPNAPAAAAVGPAFFASGEPDAPEVDIARSTAGERIALVLSILLPPIGVIASVIGAILSTRRRGWVVGVLKAGIAVGLVMTVLTGIGGSIAYGFVEQQRQHDETAASSAAFCATIRANPAMIQRPTFGWPAVAASIPDSLSAMQAYEQRFATLATVSPVGIRADVTKVSTAAQQIIDSVNVARTVNDASNIAVMTSIASASGIPGWYEEYCS
jgi:hypothetical protein